MQITDEQAKIIASALMKPINDGYGASQFGVYNGNQGVVGLKRRFKKCIVFVEFDDKPDKSVKLKMDMPLKLDVVMAMVIEALDIAETLQKKELDTKKLNFNPEKIGKFIKKRPDYKEPEKRSRFTEEFNDNINESTNTEDDVEEPVIKDVPEYDVSEEVSVPESVPIKETASNPSYVSSEFEAEDEYEAKADSEPEAEVEAEPEQELEAETADNLETEQEEVQEEKYENVKENANNMSNEVDIRTLETDNGDPNAFYALTEVENKTTQELKEIDFSKASHLCKQIHKSQDTSSEEMKKVFATLIENAPEAAEMLFMATMVTAIKIAGGDTEEIAESLNIDEKDLIMANYEYELRKSKAN